MDWLVKPAMAMFRYFFERWARSRLISPWSRSQGISICGASSVSAFFRLTVGPEAATLCLQHHLIGGADDLGERAEKASHRSAPSVA
jgi:hypothetical protein